MFFLKTKFKFILYIIIYLSSIWVYLFRSDVYQRPLLYFFLIFLLISIVAQTIFFDNFNVSFTLIQCILIYINLIITQIILYPTTIGVDPWYHKYWVENSIAFGKLSSDYSYSLQPTFPLLITFFEIVTGLNYVGSSVISISISQIIVSSIINYFIGSKLFNNVKIGLLSSLLYLFFEQVIYQGYWVVPFGLIVYNILLLFLYINEKFDNSKKFILLIPLLLAGILNHPFNSVVILIFTITYIIFKIKLNKNIFYIYTLIFIGFLILVINTYFNNWFTPFVKELISKIITPRPFSERLILKSFLMTGNIIELIFLFGSVILTSIFSFCGILFMIKDLFNKISIIRKQVYSFLLINIFIFSLIFILSLTGILPMAVIEYRFLYLLEATLVFPFAYGIYNISSNLKYNTIKKYFPIIIIFVFTFMTILGFFGSMDNRLFNPTLKYTYTFTNSELSSLAFFKKYESLKIFTDPYFFAYASYEGVNFNSFDLYSYNYLENYSLNSLNGVVLIRSYYLNNPFLLTSGKILPSSIIINNLIINNKNSIYASKYAYGYIYIK